MAFVIPSMTLESNLTYSSSSLSAKPSEPPPPYAPPPPLVPVSSTSVENQIGLLKPYYVERFNRLATSQSHSIPPPFISQPQPQAPRPLSPTSQLEMPLEMQLMSQLGLSQPSKDNFGYPDAMGFGAFSVSPPSAVSVMGNMGFQPSHNQSRNQGQFQTVLNPAAPPLTLPDDVPSPARTKIGPLGQIVKPSTTASSKKKTKASAPSGSQPGGSGGPGVIAGPGTGYVPSNVPYGGIVTPVTSGPMSNSFLPGVTSVPGPAPYYQGVITPAYSTVGIGAVMGPPQGDTGVQHGSAGGEGKKKGNSKKKSEAPMPPIIIASA